MELGWLAPNGSFYAVEWAEHYSKAQDLADKYGYNIWEHKGQSDETLMAHGWAHITKSMIGFDYHVFWNLEKHLTQSQKDYLRPFFEDGSIRWGEVSLMAWRYENTDEEDDMNE